MAKHIGIGEQLRRAIAKAEKAGTSRYRMSKISGLTEAQVMRVANGMACPTLATAERLSDAIGLKMVLVPK